jgi:hypothetical protein
MRSKYNLSRCGKAVIALQNHLRKCTQCKHAVSSQERWALCDDGTRMTWDLAKASAGLSTLHKHALDNPGGMIYPCPDRMKHGFEYATTVEPVFGIAVQEELS